MVVNKDETNHKDYDTKVTQNEEIFNKYEKKKKALALGVAQFIVKYLTILPTWCSQFCCNNAYIIH